MRKGSFSAAAWSSHMARLVMREFEKMSQGALSGPSIWALMLMPLALIRMVKGLSLQRARRRGSDGRTHATVLIALGIVDDHFGNGRLIPRRFVIQVGAAVCRSRQGRHETPVHRSAWPRRPTASPYPLHQGGH